MLWTKNHIAGCPIVMYLRTKEKRWKLVASFALYWNSLIFKMGKIYGLKTISHYNQNGFGPAPISTTSHISPIS